MGAIFSPCAVQMPELFRTLRSGRCDVVQGEAYVCARGCTLTRNTASLWVYEDGLVVDGMPCHVVHTVDGWMDVALSSVSLSFVFLVRGMFIGRQSCRFCVCGCLCLNHQAHLSACMCRTHTLICFVYSQSLAPLLFLLHPMYADFISCKFMYVYTQGNKSVVRPFRHHMSQCIRDNWQMCCLARLNLVLQPLWR